LEAGFGAKNSEEESEHGRMNLDAKAIRGTVGREYCPSAWKQGAREVEERRNPITATSAGT
jgi:hypothetical protein